MIYLSLWPNFRASLRSSKIKHDKDDYPTISSSSQGSSAQQSAIGSVYFIFSRLSRDFNVELARGSVSISGNSSGSSVSKSHRFCGDDRRFSSCSSGSHEDRERERSDLDSKEKKEHRKREHSTVKKIIVKRRNRNSPNFNLRKNKIFFVVKREI